MAGETLGDGAQGLHPVRDYVLIEPKDAFEDASGLILPEAYSDDAHSSDGDYVRERNRLCLGVVQAVGPGRKDTDEIAGVREEKGQGWVRKPIPSRACQASLLDVSVDDQVLYDRASAARIDGTDPMLVMVRERAILVAVEGDARQVVGGIVTAS